MKKIIYIIPLFICIAFPKLSFAEESFCTIYPEIASSVIEKLDAKALHLSETQTKSKDFFVSKNSELSSMVYTNATVKHIVATNVAEPKTIREKISRYAFEHKLETKARERHNAIIGAHKTYYASLESLINKRTDMIQKGLSEAKAEIEDGENQATLLCEAGDVVGAKMRFDDRVKSAKQILAQTVSSAETVKKEISDAKAKRDKSVSDKQKDF